MSTIHASQITDLANLTLADLGRFKMEDLMSDLTDFPAAHELMMKNRREKQDGLAIRWNSLTNTGSNGKWSGLHGRDNINITAGEIYQEVPWVHYENGCAFDRREVKINGGPSKIVDVIKARRHRMYAEIVENWEEAFWDGPTDSSDTDTLYGILKYWADYDATTGFNGGNHTNWTSGPGGKSCATYPRLSHYTFNYSTVDQSTIRLIRGAIRLTKFMAMVQKSKEQISPYANGFQRAIYTTYDNLQVMEELAEAKNDNHGNDLAKFDNQIFVNRIPVYDVPYLTDQHSTSDPIIGIDWNQVKLEYLTGEWFAETPFEKVPGQHNDLRMFVDATCNLIIKNRRKGLWMGAKSDPLSD